MPGTVVASVEAKDAEKEDDEYHAAGSGSLELDTVGTGGGVPSTLTMVWTTFERWKQMSLHWAFTQNTPSGRFSESAVVPNGSLVVVTHARVGDGENPV
jgi:hypothetical protein